MTEDEFTELLDRIDFPAYKATCKEARAGWPTKEYAMSKENAKHLARCSMLSLIIMKRERVEQTQE